jgi:ribonucleotide reductase alpha subunit
MTELEYFKGDELAANVWRSKYASLGEKSPDDMHRRMAKEFARIEEKYHKEELDDPSTLAKLSDYGYNRMPLKEFDIYNLFKDFKYIVPQGSIMSSLGADHISSLSNCFVIGQPEDSYGGIMQKDEQLVQLMKRRGGVGIDISTLRPKGTEVTNAAKTSTGAVSFMERFSNSTREVAQGGRRGALMLTIDCRHPDVFDFVNIKKDRTKVTGANISVMLRDDFMEAVKKDEDYILRFPCDAEVDIEDIEFLERREYNISYEFRDAVIKKIKAKELYDSIVENAWENAEPGQMFVDRHHDYSPDSVYPQYKGVTTNPCFHPDTLIETEYGRMKIKDINRPMRVYSMDSDGRLIMANASASFISKTNAETLKITLKSGSSITVTPDHKLFVQDIGWFEVRDLKVGNQLGHLCRSRRGAKYAGVHLTTSPNKQRDQVMEHKLVYGQHDFDMNVHHKDRNTYNNSIDNLELLSHSAHATLTAIEDNPQVHQVRDHSGKFISGKYSKKGAKTIVGLPEELKTNVISKSHNRIISIEPGETTDVWDIQVEDTHCLIANNIVAHNCGEIFMQPYDSCRLMALNLYSFVDNPFTDKATFDFDKLYKVAYEQQRLADDLVDLELEHISRILAKIHSDNLSDDVKRVEIELWEKVYDVAKNGRRTGCGFTALGDALAALNIKYDESHSMIGSIMYQKMKGELDCSIDLSILRGSFDGWDVDKEFDIIPDNAIEAGKNSFYEFIRQQFPEQSGRMSVYGRRNISWSTCAPTGSVSLLTQTSSGLEPLFMPYYMRRKKINPNDKDVRVDFVDQNGDSWQEFPVLHPKFKEWSVNELDGKVSFPEFYINNLITKEDLQKLFEQSPWYGSTANDIDWLKRVEIQAIIQKFTSHSISSTINLPTNVTKEEVSNIYLRAYDKKLKGVTIYRDGCRTGVLVNTETKNKEEFTYHDAPKRPKSLPVNIGMITSRRFPWNVIVGMFDNKPYEVFAVPQFTDETTGHLVKRSRGRYDLLKEDGSLLKADITKNMTGDEALTSRLVSTSLRHGANITFVIEQLMKSEGDITSFSKAIARGLKVYADHDLMASRATCSDCGSSNLRYEEGCLKCNDCGNSKCG